MESLKWTEQEVGIDDLKPNENNPRRISKEQFDRLKKSIQETGYHARCICDSSLNLLGGHMRIRAMKALGVKRVYVLTPSRELTDEEKKRISVQDNIGFGEWDFDALANQFDADQLKDWGMPEDWLPKIEGVVNDAAGDVDDAPAAPKEPKTVKGDVYEIGPHRLLCGDSCFVDDVKKLMDGDLADQLLTDPPYNVGYVGKTKDAKTIKNDKMGDEPFRKFLVDAFTCADIVMKPGATFYIWHADLQGYNFRGACSDIEWQVRQCLVWQKNSLVMGRQDYHWKHEPCLYGWKDGASHLWATDRKQTTLLEFDRPTKSTDHPCLPAGELVFVDGEWAPIERVKVGSMSTYGLIVDVSSHDADSIVDIVLTDGEKTRSTENHPFLVYSKGLIAWKEAGQIDADDYVLTNVKIHNTMKPCINKDTVTLHQKATSASATTEDCEWSIVLFGSNITERYKQECKSITETITSSTIELPTCSLSRRLNTSGFTPIVDVTDAFKRSGVVLAESGFKSLKNTGILSKENGHKANAKDVSSNELESVGRFVLRRVGSVRSTREKTRVFNLTIDGVPAFDTKIGVSHNTMKPVALFAYQIGNNTKEQDLVLDLFGGSGTTMVAAHQHGRRSALMELDPAYCDVIVGRMAALYPDLPIKRNGKSINWK